MPDDPTAPKDVSEETTWSWRGGKATQRKLNAVAGALAELMARSDIDPEHVEQLNAAVGLEKRESSTR